MMSVIVVAVLWTTPDGSSVELLVVSAVVIPGRNRNDKKMKNHPPNTPK
jgi:hypothetical protein